MVWWRVGWGELKHKGCPRRGIQEFLVVTHSSVTSSSLEFHSVRDDTDQESMLVRTTELGLGPSDVLIQQMCNTAIKSAC